jgi:hypothetical protein
MFRAELLKLRTTRMPWIIAAVAAAGMVLTQALTIVLPRTLDALASLEGSGGSVGMPLPPGAPAELAGDIGSLTDLGSASVQGGMLDLLGNGAGGAGSSGVTALCMLLLGVLAVTTDFRTGGIVPTALAVPDRLRVLGAKAGATAVVALATGGVLAVLTAAGVVIAVATTPGARLALETGDALAVWGRGLVVLVLLAWLGLAVGTLVRGQVAAIVVVVSLALVEPAVHAAALILSGGTSTLTSWLPLTLGSLASSGHGGAALIVGPASVGALPALAGLVAWAAALLAVAAIVFRRRDLA